MKLKLSLLLMLSSLVLVACSGGGGSGKGGKANPDEKQRWSNTGSYSMTFVDSKGCTQEYTYNSQAKYCVALSDESISKCDTRDQRREEYLANCGNDFDLRSPAPSKPPEPRDVVFTKAKAAFAEIDINLHLPTYQEVDRENVEKLSAVLLEAIDQFEQRRDVIKAIEINNYTRPMSAITMKNGVGLTLSASLNLDGIKKALALNERVLALAKKTGIDFNLLPDFKFWFHVDDDDGELAELEANLNYFDSRATTLKSLSKMLIEISTNNQPGSWELTNKTWDFRPGFLKYADDVLTALTSLNQLSKKDIVFVGDIKTEALPKLKEFATWLKKNEDRIDDLIEFSRSTNPKATKTFRIVLTHENKQGEIWEEERAHKYFSESQNNGLRIQLFNFNPSALEALFDTLPFLKETNTRINEAILDENHFTSTVDLLKQRTEKIKSLNGKIQTLRFRFKKTEFSSGTLAIGKNATLEDIDKALNSIK